MGLYRGSLLITPIRSKNSDATFEDFLNNSLSSVEIPNNITDIREYTFYNLSSLESVNLSNSLTNIGDHSFEGTGITSINIPSSITYISNNAFSNCSNLSDIYIDKYYNDIPNAPWGATNAVVHWKDVSGSIDLTDWNYNLVDGIAIINRYDGSDDNVTIPALEG